MIELTATKLSAPAARPGYIARPALLAALCTAMSRRLVLIAAPTGYGKSVLMSSWFATPGADPAAWVCLDNSDNDPVLLTRYLIAAFRSAGVQVGRRTEVLLQVPGAAPHAWMASLVNELADAETPVVLVLEDYHVITHGECHAVVQYLLDHAPDALHVVVTTRVDPPLLLARLRAAGQLVELRADDLRFTALEAELLLVAEEGLALSEGSVAHLTDRTEGWAAGLYLAALWLRRSADADADALLFAGSNRHVADLLMEAVLQQLDPWVRDALIRTSVVERLSAPLCATLIGRPGAALLRDLERSNLFLIPLDATRTWYRYHHLFRDVLRGELAQQHPDVAQAVHRRAAAWFQDAGMVSEAIEHALAADDTEHAAALVREHWLTVGRLGQDATIRRWLAAFTAPQLRRHPDLGVVGGLAVGVSGGTAAEFRRWSALAESAAPAEYVRVGGAGLDLLRSAFGYDSVRTALAASRRSLATEPPAQGDLQLAAVANLGQLCYFAGDLTAARASSLRALRDPTIHSRPYAHITALTTLALVELDSDANVEGERWACRAQKVASDVGLDAHQVTGLAHVALGRALAAGGRGAAAAAELDRGLKLVTGGVLPLREAYALICAAAVQPGHSAGSTPETLLDRAEELLAGFVDAGVLTNLLRQARLRQARTVRRRERSEATGLTTTELAVLRLLDSPRSQRGIASELTVSVNTVKSHISAIYRKLHASSRDAAVDAARGLNLL